MTNSAIKIPEEDRCSFCDYLGGVRPFSFVSRGDLVATMVTREQRGVPHLLVIPIAHRETVLDVTDAEATALIIAVREAARAIDVAYRRPGISVWQNNGTSASQTIPHVHFHVAGTLDSGDTNWGEVEELPISETDYIAGRIRSALTTPRDLLSHGRCVVARPRWAEAW